jgi:lipopolysaccharide export system protein LptA
MKLIEVTFYFKDDTILKVKSKEGIYNNKTLDMIFMGNVEALYEDTKLTADKANYSNLNSFLTISNNVVVTDKKGVLVADKLLFDIQKQSLNIESFNNNKINANIKN